MRVQPWYLPGGHVAGSQRFRVAGCAEPIQNSAFHDLFPFRKSLNVLLPDTALQKVSLRFFSEHARKRDNQLIYRDMELVDVLLAFTRARDRRAPSRFWHRNLQVMEALIELFGSTGAFLKLLHSASTE